ncbi:hypothetical protein JZU48_01460, partial [bacterium]|nr:hypothetical protein [bacterium]
RSQYIDFSRAASQASWLSPGQGREEILNGLAAYSATVINAIERAFRQADAVEVYVLQRDAAIGLESSVRAASQA